MTHRRDTGTTHFSLTRLFSKSFHWNDLIFIPMLDIYKENMYQKSKENIHFLRSYEQKEFEKNIIE